MFNSNFVDEIAHRCNSKEPIDSIERDVRSYFDKWNIHNTLTFLVISDLLEMKRSGHILSNKHIVQNWKKSRFLDLIPEEILSDDDFRLTTEKVYKLTKLTPNLN